MTTKISSDNIQPSTLSTIGGGPTISNVQVTNSSYVVLNDTAVDTLGGYIKITGSKFSSGAQVYIGSTLATSVSLVSSTVLNVQVPATAAGSYDLYVVNSDGSFGVKPNGITFSPINITWVTGSTLQTQGSGVPISIQLSATGATGYQLQTGSTLPTGLTLTSGGLLSGTVTVTNDTTYSFTIEAYDAELQDAPRTFSLSVVTVNYPPTVEYLIVAGGGAGAAFAGGGGGGGYLTGTASVTTGTYTVTVGSGGAGAVFASNTTASNGANSSVNFSSGTITAIGGGGGANRNDGTSPTSGKNGANGGSGGGGSPADGAPRSAGGTATSGQGNNGGQGAGYGWGGGGGGGAGAAGSDGSGNAGGNGGNGLQTSISGTATYYAGGGGGGTYTSSAAGTGGLGGGAAGKVAGGGAAASNGTVNTGGGAGGGGNYTGGTPGSGGSGIVIIRYSDVYLAATATTGSPTYTVAGGYRVYKFTGSGTITF